MIILPNMERIDRELDFFQGQGRKKNAKNSNIQILKKNVTRDTPSNDCDQLCQL